MIKVQFVNFDLGSICVLGHVTGRSGKNYVDSRFRNGRHESELISVERYTEIIEDVSRRWHLPLCRWVPFFVEVPDASSVPTLEETLEKLISVGIDAYIAEQFAMGGDKIMHSLGRSIQIRSNEQQELAAESAEAAKVTEKIITGDHLGAPPSTVSAPDFSRNSLPEPEVATVEETGTIVATHTEPPVEDLSKLPFFELRKRAYTKQKAGNIPVRVEKMKTTELIEFLKAA